MKKIKLILFKILKLVTVFLRNTKLHKIIPFRREVYDFLFKKFWSGGDVLEIQGSKMYINVKEKDPNMRKTFQAYVSGLIHEEATTNLFKKAVREKDIESAIKETAADKKYKLAKEGNINKKIAELLNLGEIVARFSGRMEWGARALGNRTILMDPRNRDGVRELNAFIKQRDFWMPFAPSVLAERQHDYLINPKNIKAPYMIMAFETTEKGKKELIAALHPYDFTARPQIVDANFNVGYHEVIKEFEKLTGVGAVLNTSFNLHGEPIVCTPKDAISVFERSGLKFLALGDYLLSKK